MRTRAAAADLAGAVSSGPFRARGRATAALARELYAWPLALWALIPLLIGWSGTFPLSGAPLPFVAAVATTAVGRWSATRLVHGVGLHPVHDARAATYDAPGSLLALPSALTGRIRVRRVYIPDQPLLWAALALTLATTMLLLDRASTSDAGADLAAGVAVVDLVVLWMFAIRAVGKRAWDRTIYRLAIDLPATIAGQPARIVEASPLGLAVAGPSSGPLAGLAVGSSTTIGVAFAGTAELRMRATVANRRTGAGQLVLGLALQLDPQARVDWIGALFDAARTVPDRSRSGTAHLASRARARPSLAYTLVFRFQMVLVGLVSVLAAGVLCLVLLGFRPLVISSGSMRPTLQIGDVIVTRWVHADQLRTGDIVSFDDRGSAGELITHRVRTVVADGDRIRVETRGDANTISEIWEVPRRTLLRRTVLDVPSIGGIASGFGSPPVRDGLFAGGAALTGGVVYVGVRRSRRAARAQNAAGLTA
jgi:signal peptidase I